MYILLVNLILLFLLPNSHQMNIKNYASCDFYESFQNHYQIHFITEVIDPKGLL